MPELKNMIGQVITAHIPYLHQTQWQEVKLHAVENGGIWIESQKFMTEMLTRIGATMSPKTMIFFLPFSQITFIGASLDTPSISEKAIR
jgi:hypothetical protein